VRLGPEINCGGERRGNVKKNSLNSKQNPEGAKLGWGFSEGRRGGYESAVFDRKTLEKKHPGAGSEKKTRPIAEMERS